MSQGVVVAGFVLLGVGVMVWAVWAAARQGRLLGRGQGGEFLCDRCKYNDVRDCSRPERPNATSCPEFKSR